ncbi:MAG: DUF4298 domain-containing protein [Oscillospiraceae bacterium]|nr:DUF4298 domain-containing protein [Oscillospiraceae bacterium]
MTQIERIACYEAILDRAAAAVANLERALEAFAALEPQVRELGAYYGSADWRRDLADDEAGRLPDELKRGVLSEDAAWNVLTDWDRLRERIAE